jgi:hypothetical protein
VGQRQSGRTDQVAATSGAWTSVGHGRRRHLSQEDGRGRSEVAAAQGSGGSGAGLYVVTTVDWAHTENFCRGVRCREGVKARRYENFTIVEGPTYSHRFTDECTAMYIHRLID